jgi:hypothetical protein
MIFGNGAEPTPDPVPEAVPPKRRRRKAFEQAPE